MWEVLVPCQWNDGVPVRTRHHREWDKRVMRITGGQTIMPPAMGRWEDPDTGAIYFDRVIPVRVMCTEEQIKMIGDLVIEHYEQRAAMYFKISDAAEIMYASEKQLSKFRRKDPMSAKQLAELSDNEIDTSDIPELGEDFFKNARLVKP